jgi:type I restriction enzyme R subunit
MQSKIFEEKEIASFLKKYFSNTTPDKLQNELNQIPPRFAQLTKEEKQILKSKVNEYISNYAFLSQILNFSDTNLEKLYAYLRFARHKMPIEKEKLPIEVIQSIDIDSYELKRNTEKQIKLEDKEGALHSTKIKKQKISEDLEESLSKIIKDINERFGDKFNAKDLVKLEDLEQRLEQDKDLAEKIKNNSIDNAKLGFESSFEKHLISIMQEHLDFYQKIDSDYELKNLLKEELFKYLTQKLLRLS